MASQIVVVLDAPPLERCDWADAVFAQADLVAVDNDAITDAMAKDPDAKQALLAHADDPIAAAGQLAPHYRRALEKRHGQDARLGLYGTAWLVYVDVDACVIDWSEVERRATAEDVPAVQGNYFRGQSHAFVDARTAAHLKPGRLLELEPALPQPAVVERALSFLRTLGLA